MAYWHDSLSLWSHAVLVTPDNPEAQLFLGLQLDNAGRPEEALEHYHAALASSGILPAEYLNIGELLQKHGELEQAIMCYQNALRLGAEYDDIQADAHNNLGMALLRLGKTSEAKQHFLEALSYDPQLSFAYVGLGRVARQEGRTDEAISLYYKSIQINPSGWAYVRLGEAYEEQSKFDEALVAYESALKISPQMIEAQQHIDSLKKNLPERENRKKNH
jgi:tetratricopeptide (TPR) repeat protein